ncbi:MAG: hypothetical protein Q9180_009199, partial [Flavoplaca navasiana]
KKGEENKENEDTKPHFQGQGQTLRGGTKRKGADGEGETKETGKGKEVDDTAKGSGQKLGGGRTLRDIPKQ